MKKYPLVNEMEYTFYHITHKGTDEDNRLPVISRMYLVVLEIRQEYALLWTAYPIERQHTEEKLLKEYEDYKKARTALRRSRNLL